MASRVLAEGRSSGAPSDLELFSDEDLVQYVRSGVEPAYTTLFHRYYAQVLRVTGRILKNTEEAEDAAQIVFWDVSRAFHLYDAKRGTFRTWLLQYAYHRALNHKKTLQTRGFYQHCAIDSIDKQVLQEALHSTSRHLLPSEAAHAIHQALMHLTEPQRATLKMIFLEGLTLADVALRFDQSEGNVRHHYYRGMRKLREILLSHK